MTATILIDHSLIYQGSVVLNIRINDDTSL